MEKTRYGFLTLPNYSLIAVTNALEPLRMANRVVGQPVYEWTLVSFDGRPATASSGLELGPTVALEQLGKVEILFVCGGINVREAVTPALLAALRRLAERRAGLQCYRELLFQRLAMLEPGLEQFPFDELPARGRDLKSVEDQTDAILAAYIGAWWWYWGRERTLVLGDEESGFIVVPVAPDSALLANT